MASRPHTEIILDSITDGVFTVDPDWNITSFNRAAEQITGVSREQAVGQKCFDVFRADICQTACALRQTIATGEPLIDHRATIIDGDGERIPVSISTAVLRNDQGVITGGVETFRDLSAIETLREEIRGSYRLGEIISKSREIQRIFRILPDVAASESTVLIEGPSGSGKELFARAIHDLSGRGKQKYVVVNCGALPATLLESELFGYRRGAFTDAKRDKPGRFALAEGGTILLDEIGELPRALQVKLLRVLQEREYEPLGATEPVKADVRIIASTNRDLAKAVAAGEFRDDLYYRINVVRLTLPPLARRREDIPLLIDHFIARMNARMGKSIEGVADDALELLMRHSYPGNIRELENVIEHAMILCHGRWVTKEHLPDELIVAVRGRGGDRDEPAGPSRAALPTPEGLEKDTHGAVPTERAAGNALARAEAAAIIETLERHGGNRRRAAAELGIHPTTLWRRMKKLGLEAPRREGPRGEAPRGSQA